MLGGLALAGHTVPFEDMPRKVAECGARAGFFHPWIYVADLQEQLLVPLPGQHDGSGQELLPLGIDTTVAGRAFRSVELVPAAAPQDPASGGTPAAAGPQRGPQRVWVPLLDGTERIGVLAITVPGLNEATQLRVRQLAALLAVILVSKRQASDTYARLVRTRPMELSAEVLWSLLPQRAFANERVVISAALEPAYVVGGDAFDYAVAGDTLHLAIFDAMGHDTAAGLTATLALAAYRNHRRRDADLVEAGEAIDAVIAEQFGQMRYATAILATLDMRTGRLTWANRGHHPPLIIRRGRVVAVLDAPPDPPMGFNLGAHQPPAGYQLEPGDRLLLYSDGIIEAQSPDGQLFGLDRFTDFIIRREADGLSAPETLRRLIQTILDHQHGRLQDDATVLLVEWRAQQHFAGPDPANPASALAPRPR